jgi:FkbM family methyltransferase
MIYEHYGRIIAASDNPVVFELGAADGTDTTHLLAPVLASGKPYRFLAFEPDPYNVETLRASGLAGLVDIVPVAVGDRAGMVPFRPSGEYKYSGSVKTPVEHLKTWPRIRFGSPTQVPMLRLDDVFSSQNLNHVDFVWSDVQGAEDLVIAGAQTTLRHTRFFYTEHYEIEMYEGQIGLEEIHGRLPGNWNVVADFGSDVLFENLGFE